MEAPEKLYVDTEDRLSDSILYGFTERRKDDDVEYTRTDAFIEKAENFIYSALNDGIMGTANIEDFMRLQKKQMLEKAVMTAFNVSLPCGVYDRLKAKGCKEGDKLLIIIKED